ncbi:MAG: glycosyltransferase family 39 protein [Rhodobacteraceae bacterium]|nr:glycosyltransferase family 39 protein [Paracoccaceae bacterium]
MGKRGDLLWLGLILLLALALRLPGLNGPLWYDEILTIQTHLTLGWGEMLQSYSMNHHYLHNLAAKLSMSLFGSDPWAIRLPALLFGLGSIAALWLLARDMAGRGIAHAAALLLALSYHHIWFSQNARGYTGLALFSTLALIAFLRGLKRPGGAVWVVFALSMAATIFTHLTGAFFFVTLGLVWLGWCGVRMRQGGLGPEQVRMPFVGFLLGGLATLGLYATIIPSMLHAVSEVAASSATDPMQEYQNPLWAAYEGLRTGMGQAGPQVLIVGVLVLALALTGALSLRRRAPLFGWITLGHILLTVAILLMVGMRIWPRFFFTDIGLVLLLVVAGVQSVCATQARLLPARVGPWLFPMAVLAMAMVSAAMAEHNYTAPKQDLAGAVAEVQARHTPGERVFAPSYSGAIFSGYFGLDWGTIWTEADYEAAMTQPGPLTLVVPFPDRNLREYPQIARDLTAGRLSLRADLPGTLGDGAVLILHRD